MQLLVTVGENLQFPGRPPHCRPQAGEQRLYRAVAHRLEPDSAVAVESSADPTPVRRDRHVMEGPQALRELAHPAGAPRASVDIEAGSRRVAASLLRSRRRCDEGVERIASRPGSSPFDAAIGVRKSGKYPMGGLSARRSCR